jgi:hypothetical protein
MKLRTKYFVSLQNNQLSLDPVYDYRSTMKSVIHPFFLLLIFFLSGRLMSQDVAAGYDRVYGLDPVLYNGKKYSYFLPPGTGGNQFIFSPDFFTGDVTIKGELFKAVTLNYDIYNQQLLLKYVDETGAFDIIIISNAWLEGFHLGDMEFKYLSLADGPRYYQVIGNGHFRILYYRRKDLKLDVSYGGSHHTFTPPVKSQYVLIEGRLQPFSNKRSLIAIFDPGLKPQIKNYFHINKIKLKKASDKTMTELINYIGNL